MCFDEIEGIQIPIQFLFKLVKPAGGKEFLYSVSEVGALGKQ